MYNTNFEVCCTLAHDYECFFDSLFMEEIAKVVEEVSDES